MAKVKLPKNEKFENQDINLFEVLAALDRKDYSYYDKLTPEQQKKIVPFMLVKWMSAIKGGKDIQSYYLQSTDYHANKYMFNENVYSHPKLCWLMLCASSPGVGKQFHQWIPHIKERVRTLQESTTAKEIAEFFKKVYPKENTDTISLLSKTYADNHKRKKYLAEKFPTLKLDEIELLNGLITDQDIKNYEEDAGN